MLSKDRRLARKVLDMTKGDGRFAHHLNPLKGHPGGSKTMFPTGGLPSALKNSRANLRNVNLTGHTAAHRRLKAA